MNKALWIMYILSFYNLLHTSYKRGQPKEGYYNIFATLLATAISYILIWWMLNWRFV